MREALLICPKADNAGNDLTHVRDMAARNLCTHFGGCTIREAHGVWRNDAGRIFNEPVWEMIAAYEPTDLNEASLRLVALVVGTVGKQEAVYVRFASGVVEIIDMSPINKQVAASLAA